MTPQQLRNSILQLAIEGKLVEQRSEEGTAEELYQLIQKEKEGLIEAGQIKKQKRLLPIQEDEVPFDIPATWEWVRVGDLVELNPKNDLEDGVEVAFIPMACIMDGYKNKHLQETRYWKEIKKGFTHFADNDIAIAKITPCFQNRKSVIFKNLKNGFGAGTTEISVIRVINNLLINEYLLWFFKSEYFIFNGVKSFTGTAGQQRIHKDYLSQCLIPIPPIMEQKRIVQKIETIFPIIDRYENAWHKLNELNKKFPEELQKSILQAAIQGKLCKQKYEDGFDESLVKAISLEKEYLIESGQIKKQKELAPIQEDEIPFDIPKGWQWDRLGNISTYNQTKEKVKAVDLDGSTWVLDLENIEKNTGKIINYITAKDKNVRGEKVIFYKGQLLYSKLRPYLKKILIAPDNGVCTPELVPFDILGGCNRKYILYVLKSPYVDFLINSVTYGVKMPRVSADTMLNILIPIPSINEQNIIVKIVERLNILCDKLKMLIE